MTNLESLTKLRELLNNPENIKRATEHIELHQKYSKQVSNYLLNEEREFQKELDRELYPYYY